jgi:hypothetical protein
LLLKQVSQWGFPVAGIEVSKGLRDDACRLLGPQYAPYLRLGDILDYQFGADERYSLIYWNDVLEHIPPDEVLECLEKTHELLVPGGQLVTITPNWHSRPHDVTCLMCTPRTEAKGLHLKEYTQREVSSLLRQAGFRTVATPLCVLPSRIVLAARGLGCLKRFLEPCLERLPFRLAKLLCRGFALNCTIAAKRR